MRVAVSLFRLGGGLGDVKGTHAQTGLSPGTGLVYSPFLFNCHWKGRARYNCPSAFIMGPFVVVFCCPQP